jgi:hypothetical protein
VPELAGFFGLNIAVARRVTSKIMIAFHASRKR